MAAAPSPRTTRCRNCRNCRNCRELPTLLEGRGRLPWTLRHQGLTCPGEFRFEAQQATRSACVLAWNAFNKAPGQA